MANKLTDAVDLLVLGGGWTYGFLRPLLKSTSTEFPPVTHIATTRDGRDGTLKWEWDPLQDGDGQYVILPRAKTVVIVFPIKSEGAVTRLVEGYEQVHGPGVRWIQLGSTGIFDGGPTLTSRRLATSNPPSPTKSVWIDRHSPYDLSNDRAKSEDELLQLRPNSFALDLSGLWGGSRDPALWIPRIASTKEAVANKGSVHLIHGMDVARAIIAVHFAPNIADALVQITQSEEKQPVSLGEQSGTNEEVTTKRYGKRKGLKGKRYILTDLRVYDWWDIISAWTSEIKHEFQDPSSSRPSLEKDEKERWTNSVEKGDDDDTRRKPALWIQTLMRQTGVKALPRCPEELGRALDSRDFWEDFKIEPVKGRWERARL